MPGSIIRGYFHSNMTESEQSCKWTCGPHADDENLGVVDMVSIPRSNQGRFRRRLCLCLPGPELSGLCGEERVQEMLFENHRLAHLCSGRFSIPIQQPSSSDQMASMLRSI